MHTHSHHHSMTLSRLKWALILTIAVFVVEFLGALASGSLSVLSNAVHLLSDVGAMGLAYYAARVETNPPTLQLSYGYARSSILASLINSLILALLALGLIVAGLYRLLRPAPLMATSLIWLGLLALLFNILVTGLLAGGQSRDLNIRTMFWHAAGDAIGSLSVALSGLLIIWTHWSGFDALAGIAIGITLLIAALRIIRRSVNILMEGTPPKSNLPQSKTRLWPFQVFMRYTTSIFGPWAPTIICFRPIFSLTTFHFMKAKRLSRP